jgi:signal transduction histidine kinase
MQRTPLARFRLYCLRYSRLTGALTIVVGLVVLIGWWFDLEPLTSLSPKWPPMVANSALMSAVAGLSLLLSTSTVSKETRAFGTLCAATVLVVAGATLIEYGLDVDLGVDQLFVRTSTQVGARYPGRPASQTAAAFLFIGAALLVMDRRTARGRRPADFLALVSGSISLIALLGYLFGAESLYGAPHLLPHTGIAFHTAVVVLGLSSGIVIASADIGFASVFATPYIGGIAARWLGLGLLLLVPMAVLIVLGWRVGWYEEAMAAALVVYFALAEGAVFVVLTATRLSRLDGEAKREEETRKRTEAQLVRAHDTERRLRAELEELGRAARAVSESVTDASGSNVETVLQVIALQAQTMTHADYVAIGVGTDPEQPFNPWVFIGPGQEVADAIGRSPRPVGTLGRVACAGEIIRSADVRRHPTFRGFPPHHPEMEALLGVPILHRGRPVGNLYLGKNHGAAEFSDNDERLIRMLAARVAVAIETAWLYAGEANQRVWLQTIIDQMPEAVILLDEHGRLKALNQAIMALSCGDTGDTDRYGNPMLFDIRALDGSVVPFEELPVVRALEAGEVSMGQELLLRQRDGRMVTIVVNAAPVRSSTGQITGAVGLLQDISARKELERLREEWAAVVAHDLRQPISIISLTVGSLLKRHALELPDQQRKELERIRAASGRLNRMIDDLLDASRIEARRLSVECTMVDLTTLIESVVESLQDVTAGHSVRIVGEPDQSAWIDADRIHQVLGNLIANAAKYGSPDTDISIDVVKRDDVVEVIVTNHGPGIPPDQLPLLFSRFTRTREARTSGAPGLGLGLYISKGLVEAHGGRLWAESVPGETTSFHLTIPRTPRAPLFRAEAESHASM